MAQEASGPAAARKAIAGLYNALMTGLGLTPVSRHDEQSTHSRRLSLVTSGNGETITWTIR
ncbi:MAG: hypothetical protein HY859_12815 [Caulobacterales bacterium]|nr:hypothetical protein [Caulobacterales bacterium]